MMTMTMFQCVEKLGKGCLSEADMETLVTMLTKLLQKHFERQAERHGQFPFLV